MAECRRQAFMRKRPCLRRSPVETSLMRSLLFVPADSRRKLEKALGSGADALLIDLEDSVALAAPRPRRARLRAPSWPSKRSAATGRASTCASTRWTPASPMPISTPSMPAGPDGDHAAEGRWAAWTSRISRAKLAVREAESGLRRRRDPHHRHRDRERPARSSHSAPIAGASHRLVGLTWGAEDLSADLGAETNRGADGALRRPLPPRPHADAARRAGGAASTPIDTVFTQLPRRGEGLRAECDAARRDGFTAKMAIHPAQVPVINEVFTPSPEAVARAQRSSARSRQTPAQASSGWMAKCWTGRI